MSYKLRKFCLPTLASSPLRSVILFPSHPCAADLALLSRSAGLWLIRAGERARSESRAAARGRQAPSEDSRKRGGGERSGVQWFRGQVAKVTGIVYSSKGRSGLLITSQSPDSVPDLTHVYQEMNRGAFPLFSVTGLQP